MYGYAHIQFKMGKVEEAEKHCIALLDRITQTKSFSLDHPRTISIAELLLSIYSLQGRKSDIDALQEKVPKAGLAKEQDRFDPYAIRKGSRQLSQAPRRLELTGRPTPDSASPQQAKSPSAVLPEQQNREPIRRLVIRHTF
jgi:hypothetical protein